MRKQDQQRPLPSGRRVLMSVGVLAVCAATLVVVLRPNLDDKMKDGINDDIGHVARGGLEMRGDEPLPVRPDGTDEANGRKSQDDTVMPEDVLDFAGNSGLSDLDLVITPQSSSDAVSITGDVILGHRRAVIDLEVDDPRHLFSEAGSQGTLALWFDTVPSRADAAPSTDPADSGLIDDLHAMLGALSLFASGPLLIEGQFAVTPDAIRLSEATISKGRNTVKGDLYLRTTTQMPILSNLKTLQIAADSAVTKAADTIAAGDWADAPIATGWLDGFDLDLALEGQDIGFGATTLDSMDVSVVSRDGDLAINLVAEGQTFGRIEAGTTLNPAGQVTISARASDVSVNEVTQSISRMMPTRPFGAPQLPEGALDAELTLAGRGQTLGALSESLAGSFTAALEDGSMTGADVTATLETLANGREFMTKEKGPLIPAAGRTQFDRIDGEISIEEGIARISQLIITGQRLEIEMLGDVGLKTWAIDVVGNAQLSAAQDLDAENVARHVDLPFGIGGTLVSPMVAAGVPRVELALTDTFTPLARPGESSGD
ncbi:AsmA family protein [Roseobacter sinensis]|nr:AsmA-like C-terminal region-containing protein [Roseobacter sp. WL0113]